MTRKFSYSYNGVFAEFKKEAFTPYMKTFVKAVYHLHFKESKVVNCKLKNGYHTIFSCQGNGRFRNLEIEEESFIELLTTKNVLCNLDVLFKKNNNLGSPDYGKSQIIINTSQLFKILKEEI
ncbi:hypothetical protein NVP1101O_002 [Vibrio phage 1.101.O._10N.261.45.C6]|nr:hypothetical protein NVP1101O_002 [Vibrio phage 1.101.O._10N.261.45.C6]